MTTFQLKTVFILLATFSKTLGDFQSSSTSWSSTSTTSSPENCQIDSILAHQGNASQMYKNLCHVEFLEAFKFNGSTEMLLFVSIFNAGTEQANVDLLSQLAKLLDSREIKYLLVIRVDNETLQDDTSVTVNVNQVPFTFLATQNRPEDLLSEEFTLDSAFNSSDSLIVNLDTSTNVNISTSYAVLCLRIQNDTGLDSKANCSVERGYSDDLQCYCTTNRNAFILLLVVFAVVWTGVAFTLAYWWLLSVDGEEEGKERGAPEVQLNLVLCQMGGWTHEYLVIFRVGPASDGFDYRHAFVDLQLLTGNDEEVGIPMRYRAATLLAAANAVGASEMHMIVCRRIPMAPISGIKANHSVPGAFLPLTSMTVIDLLGDGGTGITLQEETFCQCIEYQMSILRPLSDAMVQALRQSRPPPSPSSPHRQPPVSLLRLTRRERMAFILFGFGVTALKTMIARRYMPLYRDWKDVGQTMTGFFIVAFVLIAFNVVLLGAVETLYLMFIKTPYLIKLQGAIPAAPSMSSKVNGMWWARLAGLAALYGINVLMCTAAVLFSKPLDIESGALWTGMTNFCLVCSIGLWMLLEEMIMHQVKRKHAERDYSEVMQSRQENDRSKSMPNFSNQDSSSNNYYAFGQSSAFSKMVAQSSGGPKLYNPKRFRFDGTAANGGSAEAANIPGSEVKSLCPAYSQFLETNKSRSKSAHKSAAKSQANLKENSSSMVVKPQLSKQQQKSSDQLKQQNKGRSSSVRAQSNRSLNTKHKQPSNTQLQAK